MPPCPLIELNSGHKIPQLAFGTFEAPKVDVLRAVKSAFAAGYRHIDCAMVYGNEKEVGQAIAESMKEYNLKREDIFVTSKLWCDRHDPKDVKRSCEESLKDLGLEYLDLYLIHWPVSFRFADGIGFDLDDPKTVIYEEHKLEDTWREMEKLVPAGLAKSVGVSNFNKRQLERIIKHGTIVPAVNQIEVNLHWLNTKMIDFCHSKGIQVEAYAPFGSPGVMKGKAKSLFQLEAVVEIANKHKVTPAQVLIRHALQRNIVVIAKSVTPERIHKNFDVLGFELTKDEMDKLNNAGMNIRLFKIPAIVGHPEYPFHDEY
nr:aldo keto reductase family 1 member B4 [Hymenolepis microstoma]